VSAGQRLPLTAALAVLAAAAAAGLIGLRVGGAAKSRAAAAAAAPAPAPAAGTDAHSTATAPADPPPATGPVNPDAGAGTERRWAEPVKLTGVDNCFKVSDSLYRGKQPTPEGFLELKKLGIRTVVNLRAFHSDADEIRESGVEGFQTVRISFKTWHAEDEDVVKFLKTVGDPAKAPVFVHCMHGSDRTGLMCAIYRVAVQGWSKDGALEEMTKGPYGFHSVWKNLPKYFKELDVEKLRKETGISRP